MIREIANKAVSVMLTLTMSLSGILSCVPAYAEDEPVYSITIENSENGTLECTSESAKAGETVTVTAEPSEGYQTEMIESSPEVEISETEDNIFRFEMPESDVTISGSFTKVEDDTVEETEKAENKDTKEKTYKLAISETYGYTISLSAEKAKAGEEITVSTGKETPEYISVEAMDGSEYFNVELEKDGTCTFQMPAYNASVKAIAPNTYGEGMENNISTMAEVDGAEDLEKGDPFTVEESDTRYDGTKTGTRVHYFELKNTDNKDIQAFCIEHETVHCPQVSDIMKITNIYSGDTNFSAKVTVSVSGKSYGTYYKGQLLRMVAYYGWGGPKKLVKGKSGYQTTAHAMSIANGHDGHLAGTLLDKIIDKYGSLKDAISEIPDDFTVFTLRRTSAVSGWYPSSHVQDLAFWTYVDGGGGEIELVKESSNEDISYSNSCYSLKGAEYTVYTDEDCTSVAKDQDGNKIVFTTDKDGECDETYTVDEGTYYAKETKTPKGFKENTKVYKLKALDGKTKTFVVKDTPKTDPYLIEINKVDADTGTASAQGSSASLAGAQFTVKFYEGYYTASTLPDTADRTWVIETKEVTASDGSKIYRTRLEDDYKVSGDDFYCNSAGSPVLPLGTVTVQETKAPAGYTLSGSYLKEDGTTATDGSVYVSQITEDETKGKLTGGNVYTKTEEVIRGGVKIQKRDSETGNTTPQGGATLSKATFAIVNLNSNSVSVGGKTYASGETVGTITTDEKGVAQTAADWLPYGKYKITETGTPVGYLNEGVIEREFTITENRKIVNLTGKDQSIQNQVKRAGLSVQKDDYDRANTESDEEANVPQGDATLEGAVYTITNKSKNSVVVKGKEYAVGEVVMTLTTDENGYAETGAQDLPYGTYEVKEITLGAGSLKGIQADLYKEARKLPFLFVKNRTISDWYLTSHGRYEKIQI